MASADLRDPQRRWRRRRTVSRRGRDFAAWLGLTARQNSSCGTTRLGGTSKMGQRDLHRMLVSA
ncbi:transposase [Methylocystis sp. IM3]|uniref:transposase n=1 Tax=unclassified Methylocystis TaxID=2625913 RepID=UPI0030F98B3A